MWGPTARVRCGFWSLLVCSGHGVEGRMTLGRTRVSHDDLVFGDNFVPTGSLLDSERTSLMVREKYPYSYPTSPYSLLDY